MTGSLSNFFKSAALFWKSILWAIIMLVVFLLPANNLSSAPSLPGLSESVHIFTFALLAWFLVRVQAKKKNESRASKINYVITLILGLFFGVFIELLQEVSNLGRTAEIKDVLFDLAGILLSFGILTILSRIKVKKNL